MCKDSLLSLKTKLIVFSVEEMCGTSRTSDVQTCNIAYRIGNSLQRSLGSVLHGEELFYP